MSKAYIDFEAIKKTPNKYNLTPANIKQLHVLNWEKLKTKTWFNRAMSLPCWCHLEGSNEAGKNYDDEDEFWIGFYETGKIDCNFSSYSGMCGYEFSEFYNINDIENHHDMQVQINAINYLNMLIDEKIISAPAS